MPANNPLQMLLRFVELGRDMLRENPAMTAAELLDAVERFAEAADERLPRSTCRRCHRPIVQLGDRWYHENPERNRGCYAASFGWGREGWDPNLPREWMAAPTSPA